MTVSFRRKNFSTYGWTPYSPYAMHCLMHVVSIKATLNRRSNSQERALSLLQDNLEINHYSSLQESICRKILHIFSKKNQQRYIHIHTYFYQSFLLIISAILTLQSRLVCYYANVHKHTGEQRFFRRCQRGDTVNKGLYIIKYGQTLRGGNGNLPLLSPHLPMCVYSVHITQAKLCNLLIYPGDKLCILNNFPTATP